MMTDGELTPPPAVLSEKIFRRHREGLAIVYIRQSTVQQVETPSGIDPAAICLGRSRLSSRLGAGDHRGGR